MDPKGDIEGHSMESVKTDGGKENFEKHDPSGSLMRQLVQDPELMDLLGASTMGEHHLHEPISSSVPHLIEPPNQKDFNLESRLTEMSHDLDFLGKESPIPPARLDQVSPPRSPFVELDKSSLSDELMAFTENAEPETKLIESEPANVKMEEISSLAQGNILPEFEMSGSLVDVQPPDFYESGDSSISKDGPNKPKSASDSQVLDPDDIEDYLPKDPVEPSAFAEQVQKELEPHTATTNLLLEETVTEFTSSANSFTTSDLPASPNAEMMEAKEEKSEINENEPLHDICKNDPVVQEESMSFEAAMGDLREVQDYPFEKAENGVDSPETKDYQHDDEHLLQLEAKHAELSTFLQERDPTSLDEYDRSDDSISPNSQVITAALLQTQDDIKVEDSAGFDYENESETIPNEPIVKAVNVGDTHSRAIFTSHDQFEKDSPESIGDYEFEVIPPKVPPHRYPLDEVKAKDTDYSEATAPPMAETQNDTIPPQLPPRDLYEVGEPIGFVSSPSLFASAEKEKEAALATKKSDEELFPFLPKESFETIPPVYKEHVTEFPEKSVETKEQLQEELKKATGPLPKKRQDEVDKACREDAQKILNVFNPETWFDANKLHPKVSELVYWRDPKKSGAVFAGILTILISLTCLSFISVLAYTSLAILSGTLGFRLYKNVLQTVQKTQDGHPFKEYLEQDLALESEKTEEISKILISHVNKVMIQLRRLFLVEDLIDSAKFGGILYFLTYLGSWFNGLTLVILAFIALFSLPKFYELNKNVIDQYMDLILAKISEITAKVQAVLPFGKKEKAQ